MGKPTRSDVDKDQIEAAIRELQAAGLIHFVREGEIIPEGLSFKRWFRGQRSPDIDSDEDDGLTVPNICVNLRSGASKDGAGHRMRMFVPTHGAAVTATPDLSLFIDPGEDTMAPTQGTVDGFIDALKKPGETRIAFLERALVAAREQAKADAAVRKATDGQMSALALRGLGDAARQAEELAREAEQRTPGRLTWGGVCGNRRSTLELKPGVRCDLVAGHAGDHANKAEGLTWQRS